MARALSLSLGLLLATSCGALEHALELGSARGALDGLLARSNASGSRIEARQTRTCKDPGYIPCSNAAACCLPGDICQPNNPRGAGLGWCCPSYGLQCSGRACCNPTTAFCCGTTCCSQGETCSGSKCIAPVITHTTPRTTSTTSTSTLTSTSTTSSAASCNLSGRDLEGRQAAACPTQTSSTPTPTETRIPKATMTFDYARLRQGKKKMSATKQRQREQAVDQLFTSMCKGLKVRGQTSSATFTFTDDAKVKADNRAKAGCTGSPCATGASGTSCDEFPFASTTDGGAGAVFSCIMVLGQNIQGGVISSFKQRNKMSTGEHYKFEMTGYDCVKGAPIRAATPFNSTEGNVLGSIGEELLALERRDLLPGGSEDGEMESFPPFAAEDTNNTIIHSVGDLPAGTYTIDTRINEGTVSSLRVIDYLGDEYASANIELGPTGQESLSFTLDTGGVGLGFFMDTQLDLVNVSSTMLIGLPSSAVSWTRASVGLLAGMAAASVGILFI